ncbi:hypothetical protein [Streptomyces sp. NPDC005423]|uniref:hypothetical protein n=1 Tax=Streptomyces sp. NPDC005423 TaxID=3155343 RepID=UPI0033B7A590
MTDKQHKADLNRVSDQNNFTDFARGVEERPRGSGLLEDLVFDPLRAVVDSTTYGHAMHGRTNFEHYDLNRMVDLVEQTNPEDLESSGKALWDARDAIKSAAEELGGHIDTVHWVGESGEAFRTWGSELVTNTHLLSDFAGGAGDQITAAAVGLASVRSAMPARDTHTSRKRPDKFTPAEKAADKDAYTAAVRVEKDRQEAINQMNRLSSYYAVSKDELAALNETAPEFKTMPSVGVPRPKRSVVSGSGRTTSGGAGKTVATGQHGTAKPTVHAVVQDVAHDPKDAPTRPAQHVVEHVTRPETPVGTSIDSVDTPPAPTTVPTTSHQQPTVGAPGTGNPTGTLETGYVPPAPNGFSSRATGGPGGYRTPASAAGRAGAAGFGKSSTGQSAGREPMGQVGRTAETGRSLAKSPASGAKSSPMGRGITGGTPRAGGAARAGSGTSAGAGRANGVVGGRPTPTSGKGAKGGSKLPRGTVVGAEGSAGNRSVAGRPGQRGVVGASETEGRPSSSRAASARGARQTPDAVTGRPAERNSVTRAERNGMTRGGTGLVRGGAGSRGKSGERRNAQGAADQDHSAEDEEPQLTSEPRRDVPPATN